MIAISSRIFGPFPAKGAPKIERLRWLRRVYLTFLPLSLWVYAMAALFGLPTMWWIVLGVGTVIWVQGFTSLALRIRRVDREGVA